MMAYQYYNNNNNKCILYSTFKRVLSQSTSQHKQTQQSKLEHTNIKKVEKRKSEIECFKTRFKSI